MYQLNVPEIWDTEPSCNKANCQDRQDSFSISRTMKLSQKIRNIEVFDDITLGSYKSTRMEAFCVFSFSRQCGYCDFAKRSRKQLLRASPHVDLHIQWNLTDACGRGVVAAF